MGGLTRLLRLVHLQRPAHAVVVDTDRVTTTVQLASQPSVALTVMFPDGLGQSQRRSLVEWARVNRVTMKGV